MKFSICVDLAFKSRRHATLVIFGFLAAVGCSSGPARILPPDIDAADSAARAMELYDKDSSGELDEAELEQVPGLKAAMATVDQNKDGMASEQEITDRILAWQASGSGLTAILCNVTLNGQPLTDAEVTFEPESFLGDNIETAVGKTNRFGVAAPSIPKENRPQEGMPPGLQLGFYRVKVSKIVSDKETIPAKYNSETILGQHVANDDPAILGRNVKFDLSSK